MGPDFVVRCWTPELSFGFGDGVVWARAEPAANRDAASSKCVWKCFIIGLLKAGIGGAECAVLSVGNPTLQISPRSVLLEKGVALWRCIPICPLVEHSVPHKRLQDRLQMEGKSVFMGEQE